MVICFMDDRRLGILQRLRLSYFQFRLAPVSGFGGVCSRLLIGFLDEVAPSLVAIGRMLVGFQLFQD